VALEAEHRELIRMLVDQAVRERVDDEDEANARRRCAGCGALHAARARACTTCSERVRGRRRRGRGDAVQTSE
jgi:hypothetical protein